MTTLTGTSNERLFWTREWVTKPPPAKPDPPPDPEGIRERWLPLIKEWYGESDKYYELASCHKHGGTYECPYGEKHRFPRACNLTSCPIHGSRKLKRSFKKKLKYLSGPLTLAEWRPLKPTQDFTATRKEAEKWRRKRITSGAHWVRYERRVEFLHLTTLMLFILPEYEPADGLTVIATGQTNDAALAWLQRNYLEEMALAETAEEIAAIIDAQHRLQPFGADRKKWEEQSEHAHSESRAEVKVENLHLDDSTNSLGVETQKAAAPKKEVLCPIHGVPMRYTGIIGPMDEFEYDPHHDTWVKWRPGR